MNYILIQNDGEIETNSFELIGASTKRSENGKIGFFGSGLKYSIAYMMRKGIDFKIFSGMNELKFSTSPELLKDQSFDRICINGKQTSYTTTMGPTWNEDWFILREIYCNAIDEGTCQLIKNTSIVQPSEGKTRIYIQVTDELQTVILNWDSYFADERTPMFTTDNTYTCYLGNAEINGGNVRQSVEVYAKTLGVMYRRGIRVYKNEKYMYDYGFSCVNINEDRTAKDHGAIDYAIFNLFTSFANENYIRSVLTTAQDDEATREFGAVKMTSQGEDWNQSEWMRFGSENLLINMDKAGKYTDEIAASKKEWFLLPSSFCRKLKQQFPDIHILGMGKMVGNMSFEECEMTPKYKFLLDEVIKALGEMKYDIGYEVRVVHFEKDNIMGQADRENKSILIASSTFDMGRREIALTLMEENEHLLSGKHDETREFETHIFSQWLKTMEENNAIFL